MIKTTVQPRRPYQVLELSGDGNWYEVTVSGYDTLALAYKAARGNNVRKVVKKSYEEVSPPTLIRLKNDVVLSLDGTTTRSLLSTETFDLWKLAILAEKE